MYSTTSATFLGPLVVLDLEKGIFVATVDGETTAKKYTPAEILDGVHLHDFPGFNIAAEKAHFTPQNTDGVVDLGRSAQPFDKFGIATIIDKTAKHGVIHWSLPTRKAVRVRDLTQTEKKENSHLAWWNYAATTPHVVDEVIRLRLKTEAEIRKLQFVMAARIDSYLRIETMASLKKAAGSKDYIGPEVENCRAILTRAYEAGRLTDELIEEFGIILPNTGRGRAKKDFLRFHDVAVIPLYLSGCDENGAWRRNTRGNPIGIETVTRDILQLHVHHAGTGSKAACRAKIRRYRLTPAENKYRKEHPEWLLGPGKLPVAIPEVRKHHEKMNKEILRIFRDFTA